MMRWIVLLLLPLILHAKNEFMSDYEYGQMLYNNPRGISCVSCHGEFGEGRVIAKVKGAKGQEYRGSDIRDLPIQSFHKALTTQHDIMPRYYLVNQEIIAIYKFIKEKNRRLTQPKIHIYEEELFVYEGDISDEDLDNEPIEE